MQEQLTTIAWVRHCLRLVACCMMFLPTQSMAQVPATGSANSNISDPSQKASSTNRTATHIPFMNERYVMVQEAVDGYRITRLPLIGFDGRRFVPAAYGDDPGIYYLIAGSKRYLRFLTTAQTVDLVFTSVIFISTLLGGIALVLGVRSTKVRTIGLLALCCLAIVSSRLGDVYVFQSGIVVATVPWLLYFAGRAVLDRWFYVFTFMAGLASSVANVVRFHAGTPVLLFTIVILVFYLRQKFRYRLGLIVVLAIGFSVPSVYFHKAFSDRDRFLLTQDPHYTPIVVHHPFWHPIFAGLGFLSNDFGLKFADETVERRARSVDPTVQYLSDRYDRDIKNEVIEVVRKHPAFVLFSEMTKVGALLTIFVICAGPGLLTAIRRPKPWPIECAFVVSILWTALNGILVIPNPKYLLGFISLSILYGIYSMKPLHEERIAERVSEELLADDLVPSSV
ncbi:MAG TPA: hypothetical protein VLK33_18815 [Terriglobales bacterium]|nr:hypothetical protein [Terriglobales bacterium]